MRRRWRNLETILNQQLHRWHCLAEVQPKGPFLEVVIRYVPGDDLDTGELETVVRAGMDAVFAPQTKKVHVFSQPLREQDGDPEWLLTFEYEGMNGTVGRGVWEERRDDQLLGRLVLIFLGVLAVGLYIWQPSPFNLVPSLVAVVLSFAVPPLKRWLDGGRVVWLQRLLLFIGSILLGIALVFLIQTFFDTLAIAALAIVLGITAIVLGWR